MRAWPWLLGGGVAAVALYSWARRDREERDAPDEDTSANDAPRRDGPTATGTRQLLEPLPGRWVWPVGIWRGRKPEISSGFGTERRRPTGAREIIPHGGVDIMYRRRPGDPWRAGTPHGTPGWVMPDGRTVFAASDGVVWSAAHTPRGGSVVIDHSPHKLSTYYTHLSVLFVQPKQKVAAGTPLGIVGGDPLDARRLLHLHFELRRGGYADRVDPEPLMASWAYLPDPADPPSELVARNARAGIAAGAARVPVTQHTRRWPRHGR